MLLDGGVEGRLVRDVDGDGGGLAGETRGEGLGGLNVAATLRKLTSISKRHPKNKLE